ncbi:thiamine phosphate synthase [Halothiobacillus sp. DCM-1]|uniref:thiamine phosphate synthase n=1 Tax=Halothiobacillus sp. DCM-1 TaxID=3112558 RepID=UPI0032552CC3
MRYPRLCGLYLLTDERLGDALLPTVRCALDQGVRVLQYRNKSGDAARRLAEAQALRALCADAGVLFLINDDVQLAKAVAADGVHLGREDASIESARALLGAASIIGVSCYNEWQRAEAAVASGANYLAFGAFFPSQTKPEAVTATPDLLRRARRTWAVPLCAIGGITPENGAALIEAGADMLAVISAVLLQPDVAQAARRFAALWPK